MRCSRRTISPETVATAQRTPVELDKKSKDFKQFDSLLAAPFKKGGMCLGCNRYTVTATLVGRLDGVANAALRLDGAGKIVGFGGFGNLNAYSARLVLQSVSDVASQEVDYSKVLAVTKDETVQDSGATDQVAAGHLAAKAFGAATPSGTQLERAISVFGKPNEQNGVMIGFGPANEATAKSEGKGSADSPDGLLFNCTFNKDRLPGDALGRALAHVGENIANVRTPLPGTAGAGLYDLENRAVGDDDSEHHCRAAKDADPAGRIPDLELGLAAGGVQPEAGRCDRWLPGDRRTAPPIDEGESKAGAGRFASHDSGLPAFLFSRPCGTLRAMHAADARILEAGTTTLIRRQGKTWRR